MTVTDTPTWNVIRPRDNRRTAAACTGKANTPAATTVNENAIQCQPGTRHSGCNSGTNASADTTTATQARSEERRVGKESRSGRARYQQKKEKIKSMNKDDEWETTNEKSIINTERIAQ